MLNTEWIESAGGPLVVVPRSLRARWQGIDADYDAACRVDEYLGLLSRGWGEVLVLGDEPLRTAVVQRSEGPAIVRWMFAPSADQLVDAAREVNLDSLRLVETLSVGLRDEPYVIFDSGSDGSSAAIVEFTPPAGAQVIRTYVIKDDASEIGMILHRFGDARPGSSVGKKR